MKSCIKELLFQSLPFLHDLSIFPSSFFRSIIFLSSTTDIIKPFLLLAMSKRSASDPPQDRPAKQSGSNSYRAPPIPGCEQTHPHEGYPQHTHGIVTTSYPPQRHLNPAPTQGSSAQASQGHYFEYPWSLVQEPPIVNSTNPVSNSTCLCSICV